MTYRDLFQRVQQTVAVLANGTAPEAPIDYDGVETTTLRYAVKKNRDRLQDEMEHFQELLAEKAEDIDVEPDVLQTVADKRIQGRLDTEEAGEELTEAADEVLNTETAFEPYRVSEAAIMEEPSVPIAVLDLADWMIGK